MSSFPFKLVVPTVIIAVVFLALWCVSKNSHSIAPMGGQLFALPVTLDVPYYCQEDPRWAGEILAETGETLQQSGCAVTCASMVLGFYGVTINPSELNQFLKVHDGYTDQGWIRWEQVSMADKSGQVDFQYEGPPTYRLIDTNLKAHNPVIIRVRLRSGITHFLVVMGKTGYDYLVLDPNARGLKGPYPLREFGSPIEALRFYRNSSKNKISECPGKTEMALKIRKRGICVGRSGSCRIASVGFRVSALPSLGHTTGIGARLRLRSSAQTTLATRDGRPTNWNQISSQNALNLTPSQSCLGRSRAKTGINFGASWATQSKQNSSIV